MWFLRAASVASKVYHSSSGLKEIDLSFIFAKKLKLVVWKYADS
jgi:hypothetical protein